MRINLTKKIPLQLYLCSGILILKIQLDQNFNMLDVVLLLLELFFY